MLHAPLGLIALLFGASMFVISPRGGLTDAPLGVADRVASGDVEAALTFEDAPTLIALAN